MTDTGVMTVRWKPDEIGRCKGGSKVYRAEAIELRVGWTRNDKGLGLVNSRTVEVEPLPVDWPGQPERAEKYRLGHLTASLCTSRAIAAIASWVHLAKTADSIAGIAP